jgi:nucleoside-diphosphate-sugar epimerase
METLTLLEALGEMDIKSYIHTGSSDEYGISLSPQKESQRESPMTPYSASKVSLTHTLQAISHSDNFPAIILKLFIVYGPHQQAGRLIPDVITSLLSGREINVSSGEQKRDFCFVSDIVDAFLLASTNSNAIGQVINIGSGKSIAVKDIINFGTRKIRDNENLDLYPDITFAKKTLEWQPLTKIDLGLDLTIEHFRNILE